MCAGSEQKQVTGQSKHGRLDSAHSAGGFALRIQYNGRQVVSLPEPFHNSEFPAHICNVCLFKKQDDWYALLQQEAEISLSLRRCFWPS